MPLLTLKVNESVDIGDNITLTAIDVDATDHIKIWVDTPERLKIITPPVLAYKIKNGNYTLEDMKYFMIKKALDDTNNDTTKAAALLGITRRGLNYILDRYRKDGLDVPPKRRACRPKKSK